MGKRALLIVILFSPSVRLACQDLDASPTFQRRSPSTVAEQISNAAERAAFLDLFRQGSPQQMSSRADSFLSRFPQSAYLAQAYEVAARASFDLRNFESGLQYAEKSLALLPENPLLLVAVADVEAHENRARAAILHAEEAMDGLDRFGPPSSIPEKRWPALQRTLKASAAFSKGRSLLQQALHIDAGEERAALLRLSAASLVQAQRLNPRDLEISYVLGLAQLASRQPLQAAGNFALVYDSGGELAQQALDNLRTIFHTIKPDSALPFDVFLEQSRARGIATRVTSPNVSPDNAEISRKSSTYLGSAGCAECHADIYKMWSESGMSKMFRPYEPQNIAGDFTTNNQFFIGDSAEDRENTSDAGHIAGLRPFARMVIHDGRHYFDIRQSAGGWRRYPVDYTIGSKFQQAYATKLPNGEIHVFPIQYNLLQKRWINFWEVIDGPTTERSDPLKWEKLDNSSSYQLNCAVCHTSQLRNLKGSSFDTNNLEFKEPGIDCEMCHGPSAQHAVDMAENRFDPKAPLDSPVNFNQTSQRDFVAICAQCHMQSAIRSCGTEGELNYSNSGVFFSRLAREPLGDFSRRGFYKDGRFRQTTFIVEALERSQCYKKGKVTCGTCHDPHGHDAASNPTAMKFRDNPDLMCVGCHTEFQDSNRATQHSHHLPASEGSRCVSCHMPRIMQSLMFSVRTHQIDDIPNAEMTQRFGEEDSPNACLACHRDKTAEWVSRSLGSWKPVADTPAAHGGGAR